MVTKIVTATTPSEALRITSNVTRLGLLVHSAILSVLFG
jgi:hypothetical protein